MLEGNKTVPENAGVLAEKAKSATEGTFKLVEKDNLVRSANVEHNSTERRFYE